MLQTVSYRAYLMVLVLVTALGVTACGSSGGGGVTAQGTTAVLLKDGPIPPQNGIPQIVQLWVTVKQITFKSIDDTMVTVYDDTINAPIGPVDLLTLNGGSSQLIALAPVPAGTYEEARMVVDTTPANLYFVPGDGSGNPVLDGSGNPVHVPLTLFDDNDSISDGKLEFEFNPPVVVAVDGTTTAMIDFVPVVTTDGNGNYFLDHDFENNESGEIDSETEDAEAEGLIALLSDDHTSFTLQTGNGDLTVVVSDATMIEQGDTAKTMTDLADGQHVEVKGTLDMSTVPPTLAADTIEIDD